MIETHSAVANDEPSHIHIPRPSRTHDARTRRPIVNVEQQPVPAYRALSSTFTFNELEPAECSAA